MIAASSRTVVEPTGAPLNAFARRALAALDEIEIRAVGAGEDREELLRFRYDCYRAAGHVADCPTGKVEDAYDDAPGALRFALVHRDRIVSSVRLNFVTRDERRAMSVATFPDVLNPMLDIGFTMIDPTRFTIDPAVSRDLPALPYLTLRIATVAAIHFSPDYVLSLVRPTHVAFYQRVFSAAKLADTRECKSVNFPVCLHATDIPLSLPDICRKYPFFHALEEERLALFGAVPEVTRRVRPTARAALDA